MCELAGSCCVYVPGLHGFAASLKKRPHLGLRASGQIKMILFSSVWRFQLSLGDLRRSFFRPVWLWNSSRTPSERNSDSRGSASRSRRFLLSFCFPGFCPSDTLSRSFFLKPHCIPEPAGGVGGGRGGLHGSQCFHVAEVLFSTTELLISETLKQ